MKTMKTALTIIALALTLTGCDTGMGPDTNPPVDPTYYTVSFDVDGTITSQSVESGQKATQPDDPTNAPHKFLGWYNGSSLYDFSAPVTSNVTLTAKWTKTVIVEDKVRFDSTNEDWLGQMVGYVIMDMNAKTFENYQTVGTDNKVYASGTFSVTSDGYSFTITGTGDYPNPEIIGDTLYKVSGSTWTYTKAPYLYGFGHIDNPTTTVTKAIQASHTEEQ